MTDVTIVTCKKYFQDVEGNTYINNIFLEYELLRKALEAKGLSVKRTYWDDLEYDWSQTKVAVIRTVWDYFEQFEAFNSWMVKTASVTNLINPLALQQWNSHKFYLKELQEKGIRIVPTEFVPRGTDVSLQEISAKRGWDKKVIKPAISAAAFHTYKVTEANSFEMENTFQALLEEKDMLVQPFIETITEKGEASLMVFNETYTHAILKKVKEGDFRVQDDFGGSVHSYNPTAEEIEFALAANASCAVIPIYGRVDIVWDASGKPMLSEMEFLDPEIWIRRAPETARELARGIAKMID